MNSPYIIAEIGTSHEGDISKAKELISAAKESGAHCVKFQWVIADEITTPLAGCITLPGGSTDIYRSFTQVELPSRFYEQIKVYSEHEEIDFLCSVFGPQSLEMLLSLHPTMIKIASPEINYATLLHTLSQKIENMSHTPKIILSDGISSYVDVYRALEILHTLSPIILRCVTQYPAPPSMYQLSRLKTYASLFHGELGVSDHSLHPYLIPVIAYAYGARYIEKHFTLDNTHEGLDDTFALNPHAFTMLTKAISKASDVIHEITDNIPALLSFLQVLAQEFQDDLLHNDIHALINDCVSGLGYSAPFLPIYHTTRRSLFSRHTLKKGDTLTTQNTVCLRSEQNINPGIPAEHLPFIRDYSLARKVEAHSPISWYDIGLHKTHKA